jgi:hypothetical protein
MQAREPSSPSGLSWQEDEDRGSLTNRPAFRVVYLITDFPRNLSNPSTCGVCACQPYGKEHRAQRAIRRLDLKLLRAKKWGWGRHQEVLQHRPASRESVHRHCPVCLCTFTSVSLPSFVFRLRTRLYHNYAYPPNHHVQDTEGRGCCSSARSL